MIIIFSFHFFLKKRKLKLTSKIAVKTGLKTDSKQLILFFTNLVMSINGRYSESETFFYDFEKLDEIGGIHHVCLYLYP